MFDYIRLYAIWRDVRAVWVDKLFNLWYTLGVIKCCLTIKPKEAKMEPRQDISAIALQNTGELTILVGDKILTGQGENGVSFNVNNIIYPEKTAYIEQSCFICLSNDVTKSIALTRRWYRNSNTNPAFEQHIKDYDKLNEPALLKRNEALKEFHRKGGFQTIISSHEKEF